MTDRDTSVSKKVEGLHEEKNALDRTENLKKEFEPAAEQDNQKQGPIRRKGPEPEMSRTIREHAPTFEPRPPGHIRRTPDRRAAMGDLEQEIKEANTRNAEAIAWQKFQDQQRGETAREQDNEQERAPVYGNPQQSEVAPAQNEQEKSAPETPEQAWERFQERQQEIEHDLDKGRERE